MHARQVVGSDMMIIQPRHLANIQNIPSPQTRFEDLFFTKGNPPPPPRGTFSPYNQHLSAYNLLTSSLPPSHQPTVPSFFLPFFPTQHPVTMTVASLQVNKL